MKKLLKCSIKYTVGFSKRVGRESVSERGFGRESVSERGFGRESVSERGFGRESVSERGFESERRKHYYLHKNMYL